MARQGCSCQPKILRPSWAAGLLCALMMGCLLFTSSVAAQSPDTQGMIGSEPSSAIETEIRLAFELLGKPSGNHRIQIAISDSSDGRFKNLEDFSEPSTKAAFAPVWLSKDQRSITVRTGANTRKKIQFNFRGNEASALELRVTSDSQSTDQPVTIALSDLLTGPASDESAEGTEPQWTLSILPQEKVEIRFTSNEPVVPESGQIDFVAIGNDVGDKNAKHKDSKYLINYELYRVSDGQLVSEKTLPFPLDTNRSTRVARITDVRPDQAGVYEIRCRVKTIGKIWDRLRRSAPNEIIVRQPLVVLPTEESSQTSSTWEAVGEIRPSQRQKWELKQWIPKSGRDLWPVSGWGQAESTGNNLVTTLQPGESYATALPRWRRGESQRISIRYPTAQRLRLQIDIGSSGDFKNISESVVFTDRFPINDQNELRTQSFIHYPESSGQFIRVTNLSDEVNSFESIQFAASRIADTADTEHERQQDNRIAAIRLPNLDWAQNQKLNLETGRADFAPPTLAKHQLFVATKRLLAYMDMAGLNGLIVPSNQGARSWYPCKAFVPDRHADPHSADALNCLLHILSTTNKRVFVAIDPTVALSDIESDIDLSPQGKQMIRGSVQLHGHRQYRLQNTRVQQSLAAWCKELESNLIGHRCYAGLAISCNSASHFASIPSSSIVDDTVLRKIAAQHVGNGPLHSGHLQEWARNNGKDIIQRWCDDQTAVAYRNIANQIRGKTLLVDLQSSMQSDPSVGLYACAGQSVFVNTMVSPNDTPSKLRSSAFAVGRSTNDHSDSSAHSPETIGRVSDAIDVLDPEILIIPDGGSFQWCHDLSAVLRGFTRLPMQSEDIASSREAKKPNNQTTVVRFGKQGDRGILLMLNRAPWTSEIQMQFANARMLTPTAKFDSQTCAWIADETQLEVKLAPGGMLVMEIANQTESPIRGWQSAPSGGERGVTRIKDQITSVVKRISSLSDPATATGLSNGGFEKAGDVGIPGWMHAQHPPDAIQLDRREAIEGKRSVRMSNDPADQSKTWIVSEQFAPPSSGRLAVSLACRGELVDNSTSSQTLRITIEGNRNTDLLRRSRDFEVPRNGKWQPRAIALEMTGINPQEVESLRITIDNLTPGRIWIDDVQIHDHFALVNERSALQGKAFLAVQGLQRGDLTAAAQLLKNEWAQQLLWEEDNQPDQSLARQPKPIQRKTTLRKPPSVAERIKGWIPRPLRF